MNASTLNSLKGIAIRRFEPTDSIEELTSLLNLTYQKLLRMGLDFAAAQQDVEGTRLRLKGAECYVAIAGERIVGTVTLHPPSTNKGCPWYRHPKIASFSQLCVHPDYQGAGLASAMVSVIEVRAKELGAEAICLDTSEKATHLVNYYSRQRYHVVDHVRWAHTNYRSVLMYKHLGDGPPITIARLQRYAFSIRMSLRRLFNHLPRWCQRSIAFFLRRTTS